MALPVAGSWPVGCEFKCPSEQKLTNEHGSSKLQASKSGKGGGGVLGSGGGGKGSGKSLWSLNVDESSEEIVPGPQSVLRGTKGNGRSVCATHACGNLVVRVAPSPHASVRYPHTCPTMLLVSVTKMDLFVGVEGRPSSHKPLLL